MALQVWIPGTDGTLKNQGLYLLPNPSYNNIVSTNNGKLGKDIKNVAIYHLNSDFIVSSWSICTWVKFSSTWVEWNNIIFAKNTSYSEDSQIYLSIVNNPSAQPQTYTVVSGDTLSGIANRYGTTWQNIYNNNRDIIGSNPNLIKPGQILKV